MDTYREILDEYVPDRYTIVDDGEALLNEFKRGNGEYGLVIADDTLPFMTGSQSIEKMRLFESDNKLTPVPMYLTRADYLSVKSGDLPPGVTAILRKPLSEDDFMDLLYDFLKIAESSPAA